VASLLEQVKQVDPVEFVDALQKGAHDHYQVAFKRGFGTSKGDADQKLREVEAKLTDLQRAVSDKDAELEALRAKQPDIGKWQEEKEAALLSKEKEWREKYESLNSKWINARTSAQRESVVASLKDLHVVPYVAESAMGRPEVSARMKVQEDGTIRYYEKDGQTPIMAAEGENAARLFAAQLVAEKVIPEDFVKPPRNTGGEHVGYKGAGGAVAKKFSDMTPADKATYLREHGHEKYRELVRKG